MKIRSKTIALATIKERKAAEKERNLEYDIKNIENKNTKQNLMSKFFKKCIKN